MKTTSTAANLFEQSRISIHTADNIDSVASRCCGREKLSSLRRTEQGQEVSEEGGKQDGPANPRRCALHRVEDENGQDWHG
jgi:thymidine kinase